LSSNTNILYYGDNLDIMRRYIIDNSINLIYLDPPFNSKADYNILFKESTGEKSTAQIQAFSDFWHWDNEARKAYEYLVMKSPNETLAKLVEALFNFLGKNDMMAYLVMMGSRLLEFRRVLKPTGSIFLHCDTTASHYLKLMMDAVFGIENFRNEIIWKRFNFHADARRFGKVADRILFYSKTKDYKFRKQLAPLKKKYIDSKFTYIDNDGRRFATHDLNPPSGRGPVYEFHGITRPWRFTKEKMLQLEKEGRIYTGSKIPRMKTFLDEIEERGGSAVHEIWDDIPAVNSQARERLGYPTQKPVQLLKRIIEACSDDGDWILDPFCGCGTAVAASEELGRRWIGIDITYLAITLVKGRMQDAFPLSQFRLQGEPRDLGAARELAKNRYQFQWWALSLIRARPVGSSEENPREGKKGADEGIDGWLRFSDPSTGKIERIVVQVKSGHVGIKDIREFRDVISKQRAAIGIFITLEDPTSEMVKEVKTTDPYVSSTWNTEYPRLQILTVEQLLQGKRPLTPPTLNSFQEAPLTKKVKKYDKSTKLF